MFASKNTSQRRLDKISTENNQQISDRTLVDHLDSVTDIPQSTDLLNRSILFVSSEKEVEDGSALQCTEFSSTLQPTSFPPDLLELPVIDISNSSSVRSSDPSLIGRSMMDDSAPTSFDAFMAERGSIAAYESADDDKYRDHYRPSPDYNWVDPQSEHTGSDSASLINSTDEHSYHTETGSSHQVKQLPFMMQSQYVLSSARALLNSTPLSTGREGTRNMDSNLSFFRRMDNARSRFGGLCACIKWHLRALWWRIQFTIVPEKVSGKSRNIVLNGKTSPSFFPPNIVRNQRFNAFTLVPLILYDQFRFFFNVFYLVVALTQFIPQLKVGPLFTYVAPLSFVLIVTITKEAYDDYQRKLRDKEANFAEVEVLDRLTGCLVLTPAAYIKVGQIIRLHTDQKVPCDAVLLKTANPAGTTFIRTDQLDGETDWKLRRAVAATQSLSHESSLLDFEGWMAIEPPRRDIYDFVGTFYYSTTFSPYSSTSHMSNEIHDGHPKLESLSVNVSSRNCIGNRKRQYIERGTDFRSNKQNVFHEMVDFGTTEDYTTPKRTSSESGVAGVLAEPLGLENTIWSTTVVTDGPIWALVVYTGREVRASLNTSKRETKNGMFDLEVNRMSKVLFLILIVASAVLLIFKGFSSLWIIYFCRFVLLLSSIIPISLRVNLELAKAFYAYTIQHDDKLQSTVVRNSSIPEELGRIDFLLTDKTGTLTQNEMIFKKLHIGRVQFGAESITEISEHLRSSFEEAPTSTVPRRRLEVWELLRRTLIGLSVCHNVTPVRRELDDEITFQAASPDEIALVKFVATVGLHLIERTDTHLKLIAPDGSHLIFDILFCFPFSSEAKRMGVIVQLRGSDNMQPAMASEVGRVFFFLKGAESVMIERVEQRGAHWLQEECDNFARVGLRTLVLAVKELSPKQIEAFRVKYYEAQTSLTHRAQKLRMVVDSLEVDMTLLGLTGVEDKLQQDVPQTLEAFRHAGIRVWMLTGDKIETATCIAVAAGLKARQHTVLTLAGKDFESPADAQEALEAFAMGPTEIVLVIDGPFIELAVRSVPEVLIRAACQAPAVICCRCSPTQKETIVRLIQNITGKRCAAVGDGGNDVSMIQAANCGIGIVGKEGKQASLAADFSIQQFGHLHRLLFWHGRNCYQRSAKLAHFVVHRGLIIATIQVIFSAIFFFIPLAIFQGWLTVGYATYYTMLPVFSLVLDVELPERVVFMFPELYESLRRGRVMSNKTFFAWLWTSVYQGAVIMLGAILLFESEFTNIVSITFTSLILSELLNVASEITNWHSLMIVAEVVTVILYFASMALLPYYFSFSFILSFIFWWKVGIITLVSWLPLYFFKVLMKFIQPTRDSKLAF